MKSLTARRRLSCTIAAFFFSGDILSASAVQSLQYWNTNGTPALITAANWGSVPAGPFSNAYAPNTAMVFGANSTVGYVTNTNVGNVTVNNGVNVTWTPAGTLTTGGNVRTINVGTGSTLNLAAQGFSTVAGTGFVKNGTGTLISSNANAYSGGFTMNAGTLVVGDSNAMGSGGQLTINGGTIRSNSFTSYNLSGKYGIITIGGNFTLGDTVNNGLLTFSNNVALGNVSRTITTNSYAALNGVISGSPGVGIVKSGPGELSLGGLNTFTGSVILNAGTLIALSDANLGVTGPGAAPLVVNGNASASFNNNGSMTYARGIILNNGAILQFNGSTPLFTGNVTGTGGVANPGGSNSEVFLNGTGNTFQGEVRIGGGTGVNNQAYRFSFRSLADSPTANGKIIFSAISTNNTNGSVFEYTGNTNLVIANRQFEIATTGATPATGHQIRNNGSGILTISTALSVVSTNAQTLLLGGTNTGTNTFSGLISNGAGTISLYKKDSGTWSVTNSSNSYTGSTTVTLGTLEFASGALGTTGPITISTPGTLRWATGNTQDISSRLVISGSPILNTNGNNVTFASSFAGSSTSNFIKSGSGTLTLQGTNTFTGGTVVNGGTLSLDYEVNNTSKLSNTSALNLGGGTINLAGATGNHVEVVLSTGLGSNSSASYVTRTGANTAILQLGTISTGSGTLDIGTAGIATTNNTHTAGTILGTWLTVGGADWGVSAASGTNIPITAYTSYSDVTRLGTPGVGVRTIADASTANVRLVEGSGTSGTVMLGAATTSINTLNQSIFGGSSAITIVNAGQTLRTNGILQGPTAGGLTIGDSVGSGRLTSTAATGNIVVNNNSNNPITINSVIANNTTTGLVKNGTGVLVLTAESTYTGGTFLQDGTIRAGASTGDANSILGNTTSSSLTIADKPTAVFDVNGFNVAVRSLSGGGNITLGSGTLYLRNVSLAVNNYSGIISGTGNLRVNGTVIWTTNSAHTYTGSTTIGPGTVTLQTSNLQDGGVASGIGQSSNSASNLVFTGGALRYNGTAPAFTDRRFTMAGNARLDVVGNGAITWTATDIITQSGTGTRTLTLGGSAPGTLAAGISDNGSDAVSVTHTGTNTWRLTNPGSTFTGAITLNPSFTTTLAYASAGGANPIIFSQDGAATLSYIGPGQTMSGLIQANLLSSGSITLDSSGTGPINYSNPGNLGTGGLSGAKGLILSGTNTGNNIFAGGWSNNALGGNARITKNGIGKWVVTGNNDYSGVTTINAGTLQFTKMISLNGGNTGNWNSATINVSSGATLAVNVDSAGTNGFNSASLNTLLTNISVASSPSTFEFQGLQAGAKLGFDTSTATGGTFTQGNPIVNSTGSTGGGIGLTKLGAGTLILDKVNTYSGVTTIDAGTLNVTGSIAYNGPTSIFIAAQDDTLSDNAMLIRRVASGASYSLGSITGMGSTGNSVDVLTTGGTASILAGTASAQADVSMQWRTRQASEIGTVLSDVISLTGVAMAGMGPALDQFVLEMSYKDGPGSWFDTFGYSELDSASSGVLRLGWKSGSTWLTARDFNIGSNTGTFHLAGYDPSNPAHQLLGAYGVDTTNNKVWAVLNHNSEFAVIPEPSTLVLGTLAGLGLGALSLRRRRAK